MKHIYILSLLLFLCSCGNTPRDKTVFLPILAQNQAHFLPRYLKNLENLDYDKKLITVYINTDNNEDDTEAVLRDWAKKNKRRYRSITFDSNKASKLDGLSTSTWNPTKLRGMGKMLNRSLEVAKKSKSDYYFFSECNNFVAPHTLKTLMAKNKPIIAPLLTDVFVVNNISPKKKESFTADHYRYPITYKILEGTIKVPLVQSTYLIQSKYLDGLNYMDGTDENEAVIFSKSAKANGVDQFICNEKDFGIQVAVHDKNMSREEEIKLTRPFLSLP